MAAALVPMSELPGRDALQLDDRRRCHAVVEDPGR